MCQSRGMQQTRRFQTWRASSRLQVPSSHALHPSLLPCTAAASVSAIVSWAMVARSGCQILQISHSATLFSIPAKQDLASHTDCMPQSALAKSFEHTSQATFAKDLAAKLVMHGLSTWPSNTQLLPTVTPCNSSARHKLFADCRSHSQGDIQWRR